MAKAAGGFTPPFCDEDEFKAWQAVAVKAKLPSGAPPPAPLPVDGEKPGDHEKRLMSEVCSCYARPCFISLTAPSSCSSSSDFYCSTLCAVCRPKTYASKILARSACLCQWLATTGASAGQHRREELALKPTRFKKLTCSDMRAAEGTVAIALRAHAEHCVGTLNCGCVAIAY
jgi:hypothetical protein